MHSQAEPGNEIDEIMRTFKDLCYFVPKKCINKNVLYSIIYITTTLVDVCGTYQIEAEPPRMHSQAEPAEPGNEIVNNFNNIYLRQQHWGFALGYNNSHLWCLSSELLIR